MKQLSNVRKAVAGRDDATLTRWVKEPSRHTSGRPVGLAPKDATRTRFPSRVLPISAMPSLLVSGHSNVKIGRDVRKGKLKGYWIYTLSFEERATCPTSCNHWRTCYGNSMPFAKRIDHTDPAFLPALESEIERLLSVRGRKGILIRLHALGDFYSAEYVAFWKRMLASHKNLAIFGYTARPAFSEIGSAIAQLYDVFEERAMVRFSDGGWGAMSTISIENEDDRPDGAFVCPEQTGGTTCCATCSACWSTTKNVAFLAH